MNHPTGLEIPLGEETSKSKGHNLEGIINYKRPAHNYHLHVGGNFKLTVELERSNTNLVSPIEASRKGNPFRSSKIIDDIENTWSTLTNQLAEFQKESGSSLNLEQFFGEYTNIIEQAKQAAKKI